MGIDIKDVIQPRFRNRDDFMSHFAFGALFSNSRASEYLKGIAAKLDRSSRPISDRDRKHNEINRILGNIVDNIDIGDRQVTMGLSSGLDSRALLHFLRLKNIKPMTYTFGQIGSLDYDFSRKLSGDIDLGTILIDTSRIEWRLDWLEESVAETQDVPVSPRVPARKIMDATAGRQRIDLHGYMNGVLTGFHVKDGAPIDWTDAVRQFCLANDAFGFQRRIGFDASVLLSPEPLVGAEILSFDRQLDIAYRQEQRIKLPRSGYNSSYVFPYEDDEWMNFWLGRDREDLFGQKLFISFLRGIKSDIFFDLDYSSGAVRSDINDAMKNLFYGKKKLFFGRKGGLVDPNRDGVVPAKPNSDGHFCFFACYENNRSFRDVVAVALGRLRGRDVFSSGFIDSIVSDFDRRERPAQYLMNGLVSTDIAIEVGLFD